MVTSKYKERVIVAEGNLAQMKKKSRVFLLLKLISFLLFLFLGWNYFMKDQEQLFAIFSIVSLAAYILIMFLDSLLQKKIGYTTSYLQTLNNELAYLSGDFSAFDSGEEFLNPEHPYSFDLDIFGDFSLYHRVNRTISGLGSDKLAHYLSDLSMDRNAILERQQALEELSKLEDWRLSFLTHGKDASFDLKKLLQINSESKIKAKLLGGRAKFFLLILPIITIATLILSIIDILPGSIAGTLFAIQILICILYSKVIGEISNEIGGLFKGFKSYRYIFDQLIKQKFESEELKRLQNKLVISDDLNVLSSFGKLASLLDNLDQRGNLIVFIFTNGFYLRDLWLVRSYFTWRENSSKYLNQWVNTLAEFDALVSLSTYRYNHPNATFAEISSSDTPVFEADACYHPFIKPEVAVVNDFTLDKSNFAIVTGANMAGKSTFLRAVGINMVLALNGMPVFANKLEVSVVKLFSSMRTSDNLVKNMSYFNAELTRLGSLISYCKSSKHTLIILDEILKGTNSKDKLNGSRLFLSEIATLPVTGIIATHDLALSDLSEQDKAFINYCFEIELSDEIDYTYKISKGVARNMNATHLLEQIIKKINN